MQVFDLAVDALNHLFFVGLQEEYEVSVKVLLQEFNIEVTTTISKERDTQRSKSQTRNKAALKANKRILKRTEIVNSYDMQLYQLGTCYSLSDHFMILKFCHCVLLRSLSPHRLFSS